MANQMIAARASESSVPTNHQSGLRVTKTIAGLPPGVAIERWRRYARPASASVPRQSHPGLAYAEFVTLPRRGRIASAPHPNPGGIQAMTAVRSRLTAVAVAALVGGALFVAGCGGSNS